MPLHTVVTPELFLEVHSASVEALLPLADRDWTAPSANPGWSCADTVAHLADAYFAHAGRIVAQPDAGFVPGEVRPDEGAGVAELLQLLSACAGLVAAAGLSADPESRAWHPWGTSDPEGSLAMAAAEGLLHTWDVTSALGSDWRPPSALCSPVLDRLFPDAPNVDPTEALLWCTGRTALDDAPRLASWRWWSAVR
ncbi:maleylpyruvate isomerase family mycothiol-dependent enzyme [Nocardioides sp. GCM10027113]|uniref:maleylpyruvate isomerase family mycothiol-dependent enzyme n=1 Tax=unclassified Nocardioides TaxID=2615069 RepID=UPI0036069657